MKIMWNFSSKEQLKRSRGKIIVCRKHDSKFLSHLLFKKSRKIGSPAFEGPEKNKYIEVDKKSNKKN